MAVATCTLATAPARAAGVLELQGKGDQVYRCAPDGGGFAWALKGPEATLSGPDGRDAGRHFAGPTWQAPDGSSVVGEAVGSGSIPGPGARGDAVPWLVLRAKSHAGAGAFDGVTYVIRSHTVGGVAPAAGCDAAHADAEARVPYSATYTFFGTR